MSSVVDGRESSSASNYRSEVHDQGSPPVLPCAVVKKGKVNLFEKARNPIIYGGAIDRLECADRTSAVSPGRPVFVSDWKYRLLGWGFYNPNSMYRVRIMEFAADLDLGFEDDVDLSLENVASFLHGRIEDAYAARLSLNLPSDDTDVYRLINSEGDNLSGLIVDVMGKNLVVQSSGAWVERYKEVIMESLSDIILDSDVIAWKADSGILKKEGVDITEDFQLFKIKRGPGGALDFEKHSSGEKSVNEGNGDDAQLVGDSIGQVLVTENSATFSVGLNMQKTGFYCDQRNNRLFLKAISKGKRCLDLCCYTGGFAISAAMGGATEVTGVDSSSKAIAVAEENAKLNGITSAQFHAADISKFMSRSIGSGTLWDIVVLDPPKLCPSAKFLKPALRKYEKLNSMAMQLVERGGILVTCSCSGAVTRSKDNAFLGMLSNAATRAGRDVKVLKVSGASEDHLTSLRYPEGEYLTVVTLMIL